MVVKTISAKPRAASPTATNTVVANRTCTVVAHNRCMKLTAKLATATLIKEAKRAQIVLVVIKVVNKGRSGKRKTRNRRK